ncbi:hypothetical protein EMIT0P176_350012 [Pseudomonas sp. IT-P176]
MPGPEITRHRAHPALCYSLKASMVVTKIRMHTFAQPADGAGGSRAAGELTLGLLSGKGGRGGLPACFSLVYESPLWERACPRWGHPGLPQSMGTP